MTERQHKDEQDREPAEQQPAPVASKPLQLAAAIGNQAFCRAVLQRNGGDKDTAVKPTPEQLAKDFDTAAGAGKWEDAAKLLIQLPAATIITKIKGLGAPQQASLAAGATKALTAEQAAGVARQISFVQHAPANAAPHPAEMEVQTAQTEQHKAKVAGGEVTVGTGGKTKNTSTGLESTERFSIGYKGTEAEKTRWLQFIWREIEVVDPVKGNFRVDESITTTGGTYGLTTDTSKPKYNTDSNTRTSPFYEEGFTDNRTADSTTIFDLPGAAQNIVDRQFDAGATKVVSRAHFTTYLVRDMDVLYKVEMDVEWEFTRKGAPPPRKQAVKAAGAANALDPEQRKRLVAQYPTFDYLP